MKIADFDFALPPELVAQAPTSKRDESRLMVVNRLENQVFHRKFADLLVHLRSGDLLVMNNSRVIRARLRGRNTRSDGQFELLLLAENGSNDWWAMLRPGKRAPVGAEIRLKDRSGNVTDITAKVVETNSEGHRRLAFRGTENILTCLDQLGEIPLPPYIKRETAHDDATDAERYQTVYATQAGSVAAPTAGLHFTTDVLDRIRQLGVETRQVTLHVGLGTFAPVKAESLDEHVMHEERFTLSEESADAINTAKHEGRRVIAIGTTTVRVLESAVDSATGFVTAQSSRTRIFIHPPYRFKIVDALLTNFHLPCSTLLMLVSAFAAPGEIRGRETILAAYQEAVRERYRFFSYGDAMFIE
jgi:S-adenosylmethionine:tRNA ribosyltransferase-isomerase